MSTKIQHPPFFYNEPLQTVTCYSYHALLTTIALMQTKGKEISINDSMFTSPYSVVYKDGTYVTYYAWYNMFEKMEEDFGIAIDFGKSHCTRYLYTLVLKSPMKVVNEIAGVVLEDTKIEDKQEEDQEEEFSEEEEPTQEGEVAEEVEEVDEGGVNYEYLNSLYNPNSLRKSKNKLEEVVKSLHGIDLRKNLSFDGMIEQLKEELSKQ